MNNEMKRPSYKQLPAITVVMHHSAFAAPSVLSGTQSHTAFSQMLSAPWLIIIALICTAILFLCLRFYQQTKRREADSRQQLWRQANVDFLTQLPNRHLLQQRLQQALAECHQSQQLLGVLLIDLDGFKDVNDIAGHTIGDRLLQNAALRIQSCAGHGSTTARLGGDAFVVMVPTISDVKGLHAISTHIVESLRSPFHIENNQYFVTASIGIAVYPEHCQTSEALLMFADQALHAAKRAGKDQYQFFNKSLHREFQERLSITQDLRSAIANGEFHLVYQPIYRLRDHRLVKAEALIRWQHPTRGAIAPAVFIPLAEACGLIIDIGKWVFDTVLQDLATIDLLHLQGTQISINISPVQFAHPQPLRAFIQRLQYSNIPCERFCFEITEGLLLEPSKITQDTLNALKQAGIKLSIDDFGTGYSALGYLKKYHIDYVKIDQSFIKHIERDNYAFVLCRSIIQMAHELDIKLIAEGVENASQENILKVIQCDYIQGFLHGKPAPFSTLLTQAYQQTKSVQVPHLFNSDTKH
ncbi:EAL domain-containing protein [Methylophilus medardicus]|uniref:EAL domain-containing protein n=2 Tax=Methylophilus medardicus TaxID=2588534 RepID=A0A5B8CU28_9PROT|nr:EAL domain-containing protein [Methylophilus medardicus]QDC49808.1 EAL domain-containing protein [Methylophilus medardicus]QDC53513.1 EAL domain-containing protein [Methylophilus medardicus]